MSRSRYRAIGTSILFALGVAVQPPATWSSGPPTRPSEVPVAIFRGHSAEVAAINFSLDGSRVVSVSPKDVRTWQTDTGRNLAGFTIDGGRIAATRPDGKKLAMAQFRDRFNRTVDVRAAAHGKVLLTIDPHDTMKRKPVAYPQVAALAFSPDGKRLVTATQDDLRVGVVKIWDATTGAQVLHIALPRSSVSTPGGIAFSADGKFLAAGTHGSGGELPGSGEVWVWNAESGRKAFSIKIIEEVANGNVGPSATAVALGPDGKLVAAAVGVIGTASELRVWELPDGRQIHTLRGHKKQVGRLAFSPDGKRLASAGDDYVVRVWEMTRGKEVVAFPFRVARINALVFSADGKRLAAGGGSDESGQVVVWSLPHE